ncbi:hypothetical protein ES703_95463 [subsurface metagenome]
MKLCELVFVLEIFVCVGFEVGCKFFYIFGFYGNAGCSLVTTEVDEVF